jgi:hypothetical protein
MRPEPEIRAMRDDAERTVLRRMGEVDRTAFTILDWVCDPHAITSDVIELLDGPDPDDIDDEDPDVRDVLHGLAEILRPDEDLAEVKDYLATISEDRVKTLAACARRLDRLCKAELKKRTTTK